MEYLVPACMLLLIGLFTGLSEISVSALQKPSSEYLPAAKLSSLTITFRQYFKANNVESGTSVKAFHLPIMTITPKTVSAI